MSLYASESNFVPRRFAEEIVNGRGLAHLRVRRRQWTVAGNKKVTKCIGYVRRCKYGGESRKSKNRKGRRGMKILGWLKGGWFGFRFGTENY